MNKKRLLMGGAVLSVVVAALLIIKETRRILIYGVVRQEPDVNGKYMSEWLEDLSSPDDDTRFQATASLQTMGHKAAKALPELARLMNEGKSLRIRAGASFCIFKIAADVNQSGGHTPELLDALIRALDDPEGIVRMNAALALGTMKADARRAVPDLVKAIQRKENRVAVLEFTTTIAEHMIADLGAIGPEARDAVDTLEEALQDEDKTMRRFAARALGRIGPDAKHALELLVKTVEDKSEDAEVQDCAREAIRLIDPQRAQNLTGR
jgi:HEAT repeat protein